MTSHSINDDKHLNRRKVLKAFGLGTLSATAGSAFSMNKTKTPDSKKMVHNIYGTVDEIKRD